MDDHLKEDAHNEIAPWKRMLWQEQAYRDRIKQFICNLMNRNDNTTMYMDWIY